MFLKVCPFMTLNFDEIKSINVLLDKEEDDGSVIFKLEIYLKGDHGVYLENFVNDVELKSMNKQIDRYNDWKLNNASNLQDCKKYDK